MHVHAKPTHRLFLTAVLITLLFSVVELIGGWYANSLALLGDAGHMFSDTLALCIAAFAAWIAQRPASSKHSFGLGRAEIMAAWVSSILMLAITVGIVIEALYRFEHPPTTNGALTSWIACIGLVANVVVAWVLMKGQRSSNMRAAMLHVIGDILGSIAAIVSGLVIVLTGWLLIDPLLSVFISILIFMSSIRLLVETSHLLLEGVPAHLDLHTVADTIKQCPDVLAVHDLHIWTPAGGAIALTAHVDVNDMNTWPKIYEQIRAALDENHHIRHITIQPEFATMDDGHCTIKEVLCSTTHQPHHKGDCHGG